MYAAAPHGSKIFGERELSRNVEDFYKENCADSLFQTVSNYRCGQRLQSDKLSTKPVDQSSLWT
jgi:hypothetical protein